MRRRSALFALAVFPLAAFIGIAGATHLPPNTHASRGSAYPSVPNQTDPRSLAMLPLALHGIAPAVTQFSPAVVAGQIGGPSLAVAIDGALTYAGFGARLVVLEEAGGGLRVVGQGPVLPGIVTGVAVSDGVAYVTTGSVYYVPDTPGLAVIDVRDPAAPRLLASVPMPGGAEAVVVTGSAVLVGARGLSGMFLGAWNQLDLFDVSDPTRPVLVAALPEFRGGPRSLASAGNRVYAPIDSATCVIEVVDPRAPIVTCPEYPHDPYVPAGALAVNRETVYAADYGRLLVFDWTVPGAPRQLAEVSLAGQFEVAARALAVSDDTLFVAGPPTRLDRSTKDPDVLVAIDVRDPERPRSRGTARLTGVAAAVAAQGTRAVVAAQQGDQSIIDNGHPEVLGGSLHVVDVSAGSLPSEVGAYVEPGPFVTGVARSGDDVFLVERQLTFSGVRAPDRLWRLVASSGGALVATQSRDLPGFANDLAVGAGRLWLALADDDAGAGIVGFTLDGEGRLVPGDRIPDTALTISVVGDRLFVADERTFGACAIGGSGVNCFPRVAFDPDPSPPYIRPRLAIAGDRAWLAQGRRVTGFDVTDPAAPRVLGRFDLGAEVGFSDITAAAASGAYLHLVANTGYLVTLDVSDPTVPRRAHGGPILAFPDSGVINSVVVADAVAQGDRLYVADSEGEVFAIDIADPAHPRLLIARGFPDFATSIRLNIGNTYYADVGLNTGLIRIAGGGGYLHVPVTASGVATYDLGDQAGPSTR